MERFESSATNTTKKQNSYRKETESKSSMSKAEKYFVKSVERIRQRDNDEDAMIPYHSHVMYNPKILSRYKLFL